MQGRRIVLVGGVAPSMFEGYRELTIWYRRISLQELVELARDAEVVNYVRHESTVRLLSQVLNRELVPNTGLYQWREGDELVIIGLRRPVRGQEVEVRPEDLDIVHCRIFPGRWIP
jgi:Domain of unknown function (DUF1874).